MNSRPVYQLLALCIFVVALSSCGEKVALPANVKTYDISYTGTLLLGDTISFQSTAPATSSVLWEFNDGNTSNKHVAKQVFYTLNHDGTTILDDTVLLVVDNDIYNPSKTIIRLMPCVYKLAGNHLWKGGYMSVHGGCCPGITDHALADTTFPIAVADSQTISVMGGLLPYLADSNYYSSERSSGRYNSTWVKYTHDTIYYRQRSGSEAGWSEVSYYHLY